MAGDLVSRQRGQAQSVRSKAALAKGREEGFTEALEEFIPKIIESVKQSQELMPKVLSVLTRIADQADENGQLPKGASEDVKNITPLAKMLADENKRLLDRIYGSSLQRSKNEETKTVINVTLREVLAARSGPPAAFEGTVVDG